MPSRVQKEITEKCFVNVETSGNNLQLDHVVTRCAFYMGRIMSIVFHNFTDVTILMFRQHAMHLFIVYLHIMHNEQEHGMLAKHKNCYNRSVVKSNRHIS